LGGDSYRYHSEPESRNTEAQFGVLFVPVIQWPALMFGALTLTLLFCFSRRKESGSDARDPAKDVDSFDPTKMTIPDWLKKKEK